MIDLKGIPVLRYLIPYILGIGGAVFSAPDPGVTAVLCATGIILFLISNLLHRLRSAVFVPLILFSFGMLNFWYFYGYTPSDSISHRIPTQYPVTFRARISDCPLSPSAPDSFTRTTLDILEVEESGTFNPASGSMFLYSLSPHPRISLGDEVEITGILSFPGPPRNPGSPDLAELFRRTGINGSVFMRNPEKHLKVLNRGNSPLFMIRGFIHKRIQELFSGDTAALINSLILGERSGVSRENWKYFRESGTVHILAISGLHMGLLIGAASLAITAAGVGIRKRTVILIVLTISYMLLSGARTPVVRTGIMFIIYFGGILLYRRSNVYNTLAAAAFIILMINPLQITSPGFILSFTAVLSLFLLTPFLNSMFRHEISDIDRLLQKDKGLIHDARTRFRDILMFSAAAWLGTFPVVIHYFGIFTPYSLLANLITVPFTVLILMSGFMVLILSPFPAVLSLPFSWAGTAGSVFLTRTVERISSLPGAALSVQKEFPALLYYSGIVVLIIYARKYKPSAKRLIIAALIFTNILFAYTHVMNVFSTHKGIHVIDVGHGSAAIISDGTSVIMADAGGERKANTVAGVLRSLGIDRIDLLILSHFDLDHCGGIPALLQEADIDTVYCYTSSEFNNATYTRITESLLEHDCRILHAEHAGSLTVGTMDITALSKPLPRVFPANDRSLCVRVTLEETSILLPGDIETRGITHLFNSGNSLKSDILILPHHGHPEPGLSRLIKTTDPSLVLASQKDTRTGYSRPVFSYCESLGIPWYTTGLKGYIKIIPDTVIRVFPYRVNSDK